MNVCGSRWLFTGLVAAIFIFYLTVPLYAALPPQSVIIGQPQFLEDRSAKASIDDILASTGQFLDLETPSPNFQFTTSAYWLRVPIHNARTEAITYYFDIKNATLDYATLYLVVDEQVQTIVHTGDQMAARSRPHLASTLVLPFELAAETPATLYVRVHSDGAPLFVPFALVNATTLHQLSNFGLALGSASLGLIGGLLIYNLFIFSLLRSRLYLWYVILLPVTYMTTVGAGGFGAAYLYPNSAWLANNGVGVFLGLTLAFMILFAQEFLQTRRYPRLHHILTIFAFLGFVTAIGVFFWPPSFGYRLTMVVLFVYPLVCLTAGIIVWRRGHTMVRFYLMGQVASWLGMVIFALVHTGVLPYRLILYESPTLGLAIDALLLSFALADRIRILQRARVAAEERARRNLEIRSEELEQLVAQRTAEIKTLHGILPICAHCKNIRTDDGAWQQLEEYISSHTDAEFSHGICVDCIAKFYPKLTQKHA